MKASSIENLNESIVGGFSRLAEVQLHAVQIGPLVQAFGGKLRPIVHSDGLGPPSFLVQTAQNLYNPRSSDSGLDLDGQNRRSKVIHYRSEPDPSPVKEFIAHEVHGPALIRSGSRRTFHPFLTRDVPLGFLGP